MSHRHLDVPAGDVLVHSGDFTREGSLTDYIDVFDWLDAMPHAHKILVAGNHDSLFQYLTNITRKRIPKSVIYLEDSGTMIGGLKFWGSPWTRGDLSMAFTYRVVEGTQTRWLSIPVDTDVLITHGPPHGIFDRNDAGHHIGDLALLERVRKVRRQSPRTGVDSSS
jgi:predicted phosphohydrolase